MSEKFEAAKIERQARLFEWMERWQNVVLCPVPTDRPRFEMAATKIIRHYDADWDGQFVWVDSPLVLGVAAPVASFISSLVGKQGIEENEAAIEAYMDSVFGHQALIVAEHYPLSYERDYLLSLHHKDIVQEFASAICFRVGDGWKQDEIVQAFVTSSTKSTMSRAIANAIRTTAMAVARITMQEADSLVHQVISRWPLRRLVSNGLGLLEGGLLTSLYDRTSGASLSFYRDVLGVNLIPPWDKLEKHWLATMESAFWWWPHNDFVMVCERPTFLHRGNGRADRGLIATWPDGWSICVARGVNIPWEQRHIIEAPEDITVEHIEHERNVEIRRVMIETYGSDRYIKDSGAEIIERLPDDHSIVGLRGAWLLRKNIPDDEPMVYVELRNCTPEPDGAFKHYMLRVDPSAYGGEAAENAHAAAASTWRNADGSLVYADWREYRPAFES